MWHCMQNVSSTANQFKNGEYYNMNIEPLHLNYETKTDDLSFSSNTYFKKSVII